MRLFLILIAVLKGDPICTYSGDKMFVDGSGEVTHDCVITVPYDYVVSCKIREGITSVGAGAFSNCGKLQTIEFPESLTSIKKTAFQFSGITSLTIPKNCVNIEFSNLIYYATKVQFFKVNEGNPKYASYNGSIYSNDYSILYQMPTCAPVVEIHPSTTTLGYWSVFLIQCKTLTIPSSVTTLTDSVFVDCVYTDEIIFKSDSPITVFPERCFINFYAKSFVIPPKVTKISRAAFTNSKLQTITCMSGSVLKTIDDLAFTGSASLTSVTFPSTLEYINPTAFTGCTSLKSVNIDQPNPNFIFVNSAIYNKDKSQLVFCNQGAENITIYPNTQYIPSSVLQGIPTLKKVIFEGESNYFAERDGVIYSKDLSTALHAIGNVNVVNIYSKTTNLADSLFNGIESLTTVNFDTVSSLTTINEFCFYQCSNLKSITLPDSITKIGENCFGYCKSLTTINIPNKLSIISRCLLRYCDNLETVQISDNCETLEIAEYAFQFCPKLSNIRIPPRVKTIARYVYANTAVLHVTIPDSLITITNNIFESSKLQTLEFQSTNTIATFTAACFMNSFELKTVYIPHSVTKIESNSFANCQKLETVNWLGTTKLTELMTSTFKGCTSLKSITIPASIGTIEPTAFMGCLNLTDVTVLSPNLEEFEKAFYSSDYETLLFFPPGLTSHNIKSGTKKIANNAFHSCAVLVSLTFTNPSSVSEIGEETFYQCTGLEVVNFPESLEVLKKGAFNGCTGLTAISFADGSHLNEIGAETFTGCKLLERVNFGIGSNLKKIGNSAFSSCPKLSNVILPTNLESIGSSAFQNTAIETMIIPESVSSIGSLAFAGCSKLIDFRYCPLIENSDTTVVQGHAASFALYTSSKFQSPHLFGEPCLRVMKSCGILPTAVFTSSNNGDPSLLIPFVVAVLEDE